ncbi:hypothetical protein C8Q74DRAFT_1214769 [Fomes fomentarius]|nr:hypothetical protein C8Q74DRAFT_1214769 [Fomes fomentarius]
MSQQYPPVQRPIPSSLLDDPAFSPDPRSNPLFFSMNHREEIYPASVSDSLSDYASSVADDESEVDHSHLPPRMRLLHDAPPPPPPRHHARSQSTPYTPVATLPPENLTRSNSARVIPVPPPISRTPTPGSHLRKRSPEDLRLNMPGPSPVYASASLAAQQMWQPPPPYSDSETDSSSSNPQTPSATPPSASSHLPKGIMNSAPPPLPEKRASPQSRNPPQPVAAPSNTYAAPQPRNQAPTNKTSITVHSTAPRPPISSRNASAPELHPPPPPVDVPPRPSTVPIPAPPPGPVAAPKTQRRRNSKNPSIAAPPRDLDRIDELDESDPLGFAWHHGGPYEAIAKASSTLHPDSSGVTGKRTQPPKRKPVQRYDDVSVGVAPGQIFPSFSQYQPPEGAGNGVQQLGPDVLPPMPPAENFPVTSPPMSPLALPVQRRGPAPPPTPDQYSNMHMSAMHATPAMRNAPLLEPESSRMQQQQPPQQAPVPPRRSSPPRPTPAQREAPQPSPPLVSPYSPNESVANARPSRRGAPPSRPVSTMHPRPELPSASAVPRPDIALPPQRQDKNPSLLPRHLPKKLVMPAPLQQSAQQNQRLQPGQAHVEILAQRHAPAVPPKQPSPEPSPSASSHQQHLQQQQQPRARDIPISHGPKVLKKRHTIGAPQPAEVPASNASAAMFAARVRFAEPVMQETKEERKRREKEEAKREKEEAKREKERAKAGLPRAIPLQGIFTPDYVKEAELAREREVRAAAGSKSSSSRKLSKRR